MKKFLCLIMSLLICVTISVPAFAEDEDDPLDEVDFSNMSTKELNDYIHDLYIECTTDESISTRPNLLTQYLRLAWLAVAQIAKAAGFPCVGKVIEHSVRRRDYTETDGSFANKIKPTTSFKYWQQHSSLRSIIFEKSDDLDLFFLFAA